MTDAAWQVRFRGYDPALQGLREALTTLANGYLGTRGALAEAEADGTHYPGTYPAGCYNRRTSRIADRDVEIEDLVNAPNWLCLQLRIGEDPWLHPDTAEVLDFEQRLDLAAGALHITRDLRDAAGRETRIRERRMTDIQAPHLLAVEWTVTPLNWSGPVCVRSALDGGVTNAGVARYRAFDGRHLRPVDSAADATGLRLTLETVQSAIRIGLAARTTLSLDGAALALTPECTRTEDRCAQLFATEVAEGACLIVGKTVALVTSRDPAISEPGWSAARQLEAAPDPATLFERQARAWRHRWRPYDLHVTAADESNTRLSQVLRLHQFHLLQCVPARPHLRNDSIPARGLHGEAYHGHVFWDELFILPPLLLGDPRDVYSLLAYRHERLDAARAAARAAGLRGAMFPWQSGSDGREETQSLHLNPRSQRWLPDNSLRQRHVSSAVAYNMWQALQAGGDPMLAPEHAGEVILEVARFWASLASYNPTTGRYDIAGVVGPDEYHDAYPDAEEPGLVNNAYTNVMAAWVLCRAFDLLAQLPADRAAALRDLLALDDAELAHWDSVSRRLAVPFVEGDLIAQFEGYAALAELDWDGLRARYDNIQRLDRILEAEGDTPNRYKAGKQADVLMLLYLLSSDELGRLMARLGYGFDPASLPRLIDYYMARTSHGSTLSNVVHAWVLARHDPERSWRMFQEALDSDICDVQGGTTAEGIHVGAMAGTVDLMQRCYTGLSLCAGRLAFAPVLPEAVARLSFPMRYRGQRLQVTLTRAHLDLETARDIDRPIPIAVNGTETDIAPGTHRRFDL
jgi:alpha,alpha-trehalase